MQKIGTQTSKVQSLRALSAMFGTRVTCWTQDWIQHCMAGVNCYSTVNSCFAHDNCRSRATVFILAQAVWSNSSFKLTDCPWVFFNMCAPGSKQWQRLRGFLFLVLLYGLSLAVYSWVALRGHPSLSRDTLANSSKTVGRGPTAHPGTLDELWANSGR